MMSSARGAFALALALDRLGSGVAAVALALTVSGMAGVVRVT